MNIGVVSLTAMNSPFLFLFELIAKPAEPVNDKMNAASRRRSQPRPPLQIGNQGAPARKCRRPCPLAGAD